MFTGTAEELRACPAEQAAVLLTEIDALGLGVGGGQLHTPGGIIRIRPGGGWTAADR